MKFLIDTQSNLAVEEPKQFIFGAPFTAFTYANIWSEEDETVYANERATKGTTALQNVKPCTPQMIAYMDAEGIQYPEDPHFIISLDNDIWNFAPTTFQEYKNQIPEDEEQQTPTEKAMLSRMEGLTDEQMQLSPSQFVNDYFIADNFLILELPV